MATTPQSIRTQAFKTSRRGYDTAEVDQFRSDVADALEAAQNEATAMESRARAAVARLQELTRAQSESGEQPIVADPAPADPAPADAATETATGLVPQPLAPSIDESETISRTLLLAQRTADTTVAEAQVEAERLLTDARERATASDETARAERARMIDEAKDEARRSGESERVRIEGEVQALLARRDFLESDVDALEQFLAAQRERLTEAATEISALVARVPNGLADMRRPLLSPAADDDGTGGSGGDDTAETPAPEGPASDVTGDDVDETGDIWARRDDTNTDDERLFAPERAADDPAS